MDFLLNECEVPWRWIWLDDGQTSVVLDAIDYDWAVKHQWSAKQSKKGFGRKVKIYAYRKAWINGSKNTSLYLHKAICLRAFGRPPTGRHVIGDHCNGNTLDCRRDNLRWATRSENRFNIDGVYARQGRMDLS